MGITKARFYALQDLFSASLRSTVGAFGDPHLRVYKTRSFMTCAAENSREYLDHPRIKMNGRNQRIIVNGHATSATFLTEVGLILIRFCFSNHKHSNNELLRPVVHFRPWRYCSFNLQSWDLTKSIFIGLFQIEIDLLDANGYKWVGYVANPNTATELPSTLDNGKTEVKTGQS